MDKASFKQASKLLQMIDQAGWTRDEVQQYVGRWGLYRDLENAIRNGMLAVEDVRRLLSKGARPTATKQGTSPLVVDLDVPPYIPDGCSVRPEDQIPGRVSGEIVWNPNNIEFYLVFDQRKDEILHGVEVLPRLFNKPVLPAQMLDWLLDDPNRIPKKWKQQFKKENLALYFWGLIYRDETGHRMVRCLWCDCIDSDVGRWTAVPEDVESDCGDGWSARDPAALLITS